MWSTHKRRGLRQFVVAILSKGPRNGAEIMNDMEALTHGWWRPSPGSVYPMLEEMVREGMIVRKPDGRFELVPSARPEWGWPLAGPRTVEDALRELRGLTSYLEDLKQTPPGFPVSSQAEIDAIIERLRHLRA